MPTAARTRPTRAATPSSSTRRTRTRRRGRRSARGRCGTRPRRAARRQPRRARPTPPTWDRSGAAARPVARAGSAAGSREWAPWPSWMRAVVAGTASGSGRARVPTRRDGGRPPRPPTRSSTGLAPTRRAARAPSRRGRDRGWPPEASTRPDRPTPGALRWARRASGCTPSCLAPDSPAARSVPRPTRRCTGYVLVSAADERQDPAEDGNEAADDRDERAHADKVAESAARVAAQADHVPDAHAERADAAGQREERRRANEGGDEARRAHEEHEQSETRAGAVDELSAVAHQELGRHVVRAEARSHQEGGSRRRSIGAGEFGHLGPTAEGRGAESPHVRVRRR